MLYWQWLHRPAHPLLRLLSAAVGLVILAWFFIFGFFALAALAVIGAIVYFVRAVSRPRAAATPSPAPSASVHAPIIEGEFEVIRRESHNNAPH